MSQQSKHLDAVKKHVVNLLNGDVAAAKLMLKDALAQWDEIGKAPARPAKRKVPAKKPTLSKANADKRLRDIFPTRVTKALIEHGYTTVGDIATLRPEQLQKVKGIGKVLSISIYEEVQKYIK